MVSPVACLCGRRPRSAWGLNLKGGTDVVVAIVGTELLLMSSDLYTIYAVVAILTVVVTPPVMGMAGREDDPG